MTEESPGAAKGDESVLQNDIGREQAAVYRDRGVKLLELEQYQEALEAFEQAVRLYPQHAAAFSFKA